MAWPIARHTRSGVAGISICFTPSGRSASMSAFITVGVPPTVPSSPTKANDELEKGLDKMFAQFPPQPGAKKK